MPALVCINKADINPSRADEIAAFCAAQGIALVGRVPYDTVVTEAMVQGQPVTEYDDGPVAQELRRVWERVKWKLEVGNWNKIQSPYLGGDGPGDQSRGLCGGGVAQ